MASKFNFKHFDSMRDRPLKELNGPPPSRIMASDEDATKHQRPHTRNARETVPRIYEFLSNDDKKTMLPSRNNRAVTSELSKKATATSRSVDQNTRVNANGDPRGTPSSSALSNGLADGMMSSRRSGGDSIADLNTSRLAVSLDRTSLLAGSAPDIETRDSPFTPSMFHRQQDSMTGNGIKQLNVEEAEEFVPSYLHNTHAIDPRTRTGGVDTLHTHVTSNNLSMPASVHPYSLAPAQQQGRNYRYPQWREFEIMSRTDSSLSGHLDQGIDARSNNAGIDRAFPFNAGSSLNRRTNIPNYPDLDWIGAVPADRRTSNLRPDVASYQPLQFPSHNSLSLVPVKNIAYKHPVHDVNSRSNGQFPDSTGYQHKAFSSPNIVYNNSISGGNPPGDNLGNVQQQYLSISPITRFGQIQSERQTRNNTTLHHNPDQFAATYARPNFTDGSNTSQCSNSSTAHPFRNPQYDYGAVLPRTMPFERLYSVDSVTNGSGRLPSDSVPQDLENHHVRSELLEEVRTYHKNGKYELRDIYGHVVEFSGDQTGSRFIQTKLEQASSEEKDQVFSELQTNVRQLMSDVFGNYVIQKMFEYGNQSQKRSLASQMQGHVLKLSMHAYGCRCVQKALEHILTDQQVVLVRELEGHVLTVVESQHGNHVIQKAVECIPGEHIQFIVDAHKNHVVRLAKHVYGCRIIQRMLEHCQPAARRAILDELHSAIPSLIDDQYGNYVIQCIIKSCSAGDRNRVVDFVQRELLYYSKHKFASNVVEIAIEFAEEKQRVQMCHILTRPHADNGMQSPVKSLLNDQYGNYVIQTVLRHVQGDHMTDLAEAFRHHIRIHGKFGRSKQIVAMVETLNAVCGCSPSSVSTGPQTPQTPTSLYAGGTGEAPMIKSTDMGLSGFQTRESQHRNAMSLKPIHT